MKVIKEWIHEELGKIVCAEERITKGNKRFHIFGRKEKIKFLSKEPKLYNVMFSFYANSDEDLEDIFYNRTLEQKECYGKLIFNYKSFLNSIENIEKDLLECYQEDFKENYFPYYGYHLVDEDFPELKKTEDLYAYFEVIKIDIFEKFYQIIVKTKLGYEDIMLVVTPERDPIHLDNIDIAAEAIPVSIRMTWY